ncbi:hypothetical protein Lal_00012103 [Lupinus albus]|nr:hypothetical protein Lal_00012103 [Lupinus albus]
MEEVSNVSFDGDMFKLTADNFSFWKPMMEDHLYCKDMHEPISCKDKPEGKDEKIDSFPIEKLLQ